MSEKTAFELIQEIAKSTDVDFDAKPVQSIAANAVKLALSPAERQNIAQLFPSDATQKYMTMAFSPDLTQALSNSTLMLRDPVTKRFVSSISGGDLLQLLQMASTMNVMSIAAQQQYLAQIDKKLDLISHKLDRILEFLYGNKKAELLAEISFSKYAYENFASISRHDDQRRSTITSLQQGKKLALIDIEFYISDLASTVQDANSKVPGEAEKKARQCLQICDSIDMSVQLYTLNCLLEVYYAQNNDEEYITYLEEDIRSYIEKCHNRILQDLAALKAHVSNAKIIGKKDTHLIAQIETRISDLTEHKIDDKQKELLDALHAAGKTSKYVLSSNGDVYVEMK